MEFETTEEASSALVAKPSATTLDETSSESLQMANTADEGSFIDYILPPEAKILPPAKYKLWLIVLILVYFAEWVASEAKFLQFLRFGGWLSPEASLFLFLAIIVFVLTYSTMDLVITGLTFKTKSGNVYGVGAWLKQPRAVWMYRHENFAFEVFARVIHILEAGFAMFDAPPPAAAKAVLATPKQFACKDADCHKVLKIEHRIKPDKLDDYHRWVKRIRHAVKQAPGLIATEASEIVEEIDEESGRTKYQEPVKLHVVYVKFADLDYLNEWMLSPYRKALMDALEPLLIEPDVVQIQGNRDLPDAFSDLLTRQGNAVPKLPPKKWKVWWLTTVALFITLRWTGSIMPYYFDKWGLTDADSRLERLVSVTIGTFLNSYVMTPLFLFVFDHWLQHSDVECRNTREPWKTFDQGFSSIWPKLIMTIAFYIGCLLTALLKN